MGLFSEFRDFINKGNMLGIAVGFVMGAAFTAVVTALVDNVIMPITAIPFGKPNFDQALILTVNGAEIRFGAFLTALVTFVLIAVVIFFIVKAYAKAFDQEVAGAKNEVGLLTEVVEELKGMRAELSTNTPGTAAPDAGPST
jgi:large conductance mechanosensitive channel